MDFEKKPKKKRTNKKKVGFYIDKDLYERMGVYKNDKGFESFNAVLESWIKENC